MGVIFSPEKVEFGMVPEIGAHQQAGRYLLDRIAGCADESMPALRGAMIYGSTTFGKANRRSDLDILAVFDPSVNFSELATLSDIFDETHTKFKVEPEPNVLVLGDKSTEYSHINKTFYMDYLRQLQATDQQWVLGKPVDAIPYAPSTPQNAIREAVSYCAYKERYFGKVWLTKSATIEHLQRSLELPSSIGRSAIDAVNYGHKYESVVTGGREPIIPRAARLIGSLAKSGAAEEIMYRLAQQDKDYSELLEATLAGNASIGEYSSWIDNAISPAVRDAYELSIRWKTALEGAAEQ